MFAGPGIDIVMGGRGSDTIFARARADVAEPGADTVFADPTDIVRPGCERVHVAEPRPHEDAGEEVAP